MANYAIMRMEKRKLPSVGRSRKYETEQVQLSIRIEEINASRAEKEVCGKKIHIQQCSESSRRRRAAMRKAA